MRWRVVFDRPVWTQPDHPSARRLVSELRIHAPDAASAERHAVRVTVGEVVILATAEAPPPDPLPPETPEPDPPPLHIDPGSYA